MIKQAVISLKHNKNLKKDSVLTYNVYSANEDSLCLKWEIPPKQKLLYLISNLDFIEPYEWGHYFGVFPCGVTGEVFYKEKLWNYNLNAGGWISLKKIENDEMIYFGCKNKELEDFFISIYDFEHGGE